MFGQDFYHHTTRRYVAIIVTLFNNISIGRADNLNVETQRFKVPINYGPVQKFLTKIQQDPEFKAQAISLPRMSFEITSISYDGSRNLSQIIRNTKSVLAKDRVRTQYTPAPYNIDFTLSIMTKYAEDGTKIIEQILPFFKPEFVVTAKLIDTMDLNLDIPIVLNSITTEDTYEGSYDERRALIWTLNFTLKGYYFGPVAEKKIIKFVTANVYGSMTANSPYQSITVQPGLTANGQPTTDISQTISYANISIDDDWAYLVQIEDND